MRHGWFNEMLTALKSSLRDLETVRMTPPDDPALRGLKQDIRKTIKRAQPDADDEQKAA
jgi:hypothetical protein